jgi:hypothetical protein
MTRSRKSIYGNRAIQASIQQDRPLKVAVQMKKNLLLSIFLFLFHFSHSQLNDCAPQPGTCYLCDSLKKIYHADAIAMAYVQVQDSTSLYYDSLFVSQHLIDSYQIALANLYNNLPDSLDFLRQVHIGYISRAEVKPAPDKLFISLPFPDGDSWQPDSTSTGNYRADSLFRKAGLKFVSRQSGGTGKMYFSYSYSGMLNTAALIRALKRIDPVILPENGVNRPCSWCPEWLWVDGDGDDWHTISVMYSISACDPPQIPCRYITRTFSNISDDGCSLAYATYKEGYLPYMEVPGK